MEITDLVRPNIRKLRPYSAARYEVNNSDAILLDANENPYGDSDGNNRYPDPWQEELKAAICEIKGIGLDNIFLGNGADEAIDLLIRAFCEPGGHSILVNDPTYSMYEICARINGNRIIKVPLNVDFSLDKDTLLEAVEPGTRIIFLCSPVNPSGNRLSTRIIIEVLERFHGIVVVDEAYIDFCEHKGFLPYLSEFENLVVVQTFSKAWGRAGIRLGMAFSNPEIIRVLNKIKPPYNISSSTQKLALEAIRCPAEFNTNKTRILDQRRVLKEYLEGCPICEKVFPSESNFLLAQFHSSNEVYKYLKEKGVIVRNRSKETHCKNCLRITIGTPGEVQHLINLLQEYE